MGNRRRKLFNFNYVHVHADAKKPTHEDYRYRSASLIKVVETLQHATWIVENVAFRIARGKGERADFLSRGTQRKGGILMHGESPKIHGIEILVRFLFNNTKK